MNNFDKNFEKHFKRTGRAIWLVFIINVFLTIAVLGGIGWVAYLLLKHFGIVG